MLTVSWDRSDRSVGGVVVMASFAPQLVFWTLDKCVSQAKIVQSALFPLHSFV